MNTQTSNIPLRMFFVQRANELGFVVGPSRILARLAVPYNSSVCWVVNLGFLERTFFCRSMVSVGATKRLARIGIQRSIHRRTHGPTQDK